MRSMRALSMSLTRPSSTTRSKTSAGSALPHLVWIAGSGDQQPQARTDCGQLLERGKQDRQPLARLVESTEEPERAAVAGPTGKGLDVGERRHRHPVGNHHGVAAEMLDQRAARCLRDRDAGADLFQRGLQNRVRGGEGAGPLH